MGTQPHKALMFKLRQLNYEIEQIMKYSYRQVIAKINSIKRRKITLDVMKCSHHWVCLKPHNQEQYTGYSFCYMRRYQSWDGNRKVTLPTRTLTFI